jgi:hypothetical protein
LKKDSLTELWKQDTLFTEWSFHQLAPYIGKVKSSLAAGLVRNYTKRNELIFDPFCGAGTIPFESWANNRRALSCDLNPYAFLLTKGKLFPEIDLNIAIKKIEMYELAVSSSYKGVDLRKIPKWVRGFFHPRTLKEIVTWVEILKKNEEWFILACLMGILHHQRPGFLSFPASHAVPYLRTKKFPKEKYPILYEYRSVTDRLKKKVQRAFMRLPKLDHRIYRNCFLKDSRNLPIENVDAIITSPPYMRQLEYGRDNRLRLWFLDCDDWKTLDKRISPKELGFIEMMRENLSSWKTILKPHGKCILILGDSVCKSYKKQLPNVIIQIATLEIRGYKLIGQIQNQIPEKKRVRKHLRGSVYETILIFQRQ